MSERLTAATDHLVALLRNLPSDTVRRAIPGAPTSGDGTDAATSLAFSVSALTLDSLGAGGVIPAVVLNQRGAPLASQLGITYESSDPSIFTVDPVTGQITAVAQGSAVMIARLGAVRPGLFTVTVRQVPAAVLLDQPSATIVTGGAENRVAASITVAPNMFSLPLA